jgi:DNA-directed RNA polymerase subunit beta'
MIRRSFSGLMVNLASPEEIKSWSNWSVESPDTINYRTWKPKQKWLFCETIFGPMRNYECSCGKYKWMRYKWIVCERCLVEVTSSRVRREKMWHIELAAPVVHIWYVKATPSRIWLLLNLSVKEIEKILYFVKYIVLERDETKQKNVIANLDKDYENKVKELDRIYKDEVSELEKNVSKITKEEYKSKKQEFEKLYSKNKDTLEKDYSRIKSILANLNVWSTILESDYRNVFYKYEWVFKFASWADALLYLLEKVDVEKEIKHMIKIFNTLKWTERDKAFKRIRLLINLNISWVMPSYMILRRLPVIPPDLRPVVQLEWWKFASSDINLFYRRVLMRNLRLKKMIDAGMPDVIKKNEIRLLQESVNNLILWDNENAWKIWAWVKVFKSLTDMLSWKEWIFRKNLLWKRVDYSWRSVITVWPWLNLDECWLPLYIAVRIFTPFIIWKLIERKIAHTPKQAEKLIKDEDPISLKILEEVIKDKYVLLNRAPTLHRLWIQAFKIKLMPWKTIRLHPLVCPAFNADFDWDQMAVHLPLSAEAQREARELIASDKNILKPASWEPIITHTQDMVLWVYHLTDDFWKTENVVSYFGSLEDVEKSYYNWNLWLRDLVSVKFNWEFIQVTVGRILFNLLLPEKLRFIDQKIWKKWLKNILNRIYDECWREETVRVSDAIKDWWFKYATLSAVSINVFHLRVPEQKNELLQKWDKLVSEIHNWWYRWWLSDEEKHRTIIKIRSEIKAQIETLVKTCYKAWTNIFTLIDSWARWDWSQLTQLAWMKWLVASPSWEIIELPIKSSLIEWFTPIEYFISAHWARKWKADTALRTAESWYLTRRLVDSSQEVIIREEDCWSKEWLIISKDEAEIRSESFYELILWRISLEDIKDKKWNIIINKWDMLDKTNIDMMDKLWIWSIKVRSPLSCLTTSWVCRKCYGMDLSTRKEVEIGTAIWVIASQSIWELWTQLTMRTFHTWGIASADWDITQGIKRIEELFEVRKPKKPAIIAPFDWVIKLHESWKIIEVEVVSEANPKVYILKDWYTCKVKKWEAIKKWWVYAIKWKSQLKVKEEWEVLEIKKDHIVIWIINKFRKPLSVWTSLRINDWSEVFKWQILTNWALDIKEYQSIVWDLEAQKYIVREIKRVYLSQWQDVNDKYVEIIIKQLFSKVIIEDSWDSSFIPWSIVKYEEFQKVNIELKKAWRNCAKWDRLVLWLTQIAKETDSWLSAASFQETMRVMVDSSTKWSIDKLDDLKSNVIIWRLLPIWEIFKKKYYWMPDDIDNVQIDEWYDMETTVWNNVVDTIDWYTTQDVEWS